MAVIKQENPATGGPGIEPRWTRGAKDGVGGAYGIASNVWFTLSGGVVTEVYYPTIDRPQIRDLQFLVTDGESFLHDERRHLESTIVRPEPYALGFLITNTDRLGRYRITKEIFADQHRPCLLIRTRFQVARDLRGKLRLFALLAPHLEGGGLHNTGNVAEAAGRRVLTAHKHNTWLALGSTTPFLRASCGYVGRTDGWQDLNDNFKLDHEFDCAKDGNIALTGELDLSQGYEFTLGLAFGDSLHRVISTLFQSLGLYHGESLRRFRQAWGQICQTALPLDGYTDDAGQLYRASHNLLLLHEDRNYSGAIIASLGIPWGETKGDEDLGGYHLVWTRDLVHAATGLLASGESEPALRALIYLACLQLPDGGFYQNFWIDGEPYWHGVQLDEVAFPILLAHRLALVAGLADFDPYPTVMKAARYLISRGPVTPQERWEENSGLSPSTLASNIAALICAASFASQRGDEGSAAFLTEYADFLEAHIEAWTVTTDGTLVPGLQRHFIRINPVQPNDPHPDKSPNSGLLPIANRPPGSQILFPAKDIVDAGFLELVRYGIRRPRDSLVEDSLQVVDALLKVDTPLGPCWHRYCQDGYGERPDGSSFRGWGRGRAWPLLTGERGHYELAAGRDVRPFIRAMERFATPAGLLPEQIWDESDRPDLLLKFGRPTGAAMPLLWAHAEYIKLLRSTSDGAGFDLIPEVTGRYGSTRVGAPVEIWKFNRQVDWVRAPVTLRVVAEEPFMLRWTLEEWRRLTDMQSTATALGLDFVDIEIPPGQSAPLRFTFFWPRDSRWEGCDFHVSFTS
jgi:glucoamylase